MPQSSAESGDLTTPSYGAAFDRDGDGVITVVDIKQVPGALVGVSLDGAETLPPEADPFTDVRLYSGWSVDRWLPLHPFEDIAAEAAVSGDRLGLYYNTRSMGGRPEFSRVTWGFYAWNSPFQEEGVWTYHVFFGDPYDDTDGPREDLAYAYPDPEQEYAPTLPTLRWEGVREGIDDLRYLYTLEQALEAARGDPTKADAVARAEALLAQLRADLNRYGPEARGIIAYFEPEDYARYRWQIAQAIVALLPAPGGAGSTRLWKHWVSAQCPQPAQVEELARYDVLVIEPWCWYQADPTAAIKAIYARNPDIQLFMYLNSVAVRTNTAPLRTWAEAHPDEWMCSEPASSPDDLWLQMSPSSEAWHNALADYVAAARERFPNLNLYLDWMVG